MKAFSVYSHPTRGYEAVKHGFSWPAFFFGPIWILMKRLWGIFFGLWFLAYMGLVLIQSVTNTAQSDSGAQALVRLMLAGGYLALWLVPAFKGNSWRVVNLIKRGYELIAMVNAETPDAAIAEVAKARRCT